MGEIILKMVIKSKGITIKKVAIVLMKSSQKLILEIRRNGAAEIRSLDTARRLGLKQVS